LNEEEEIITKMKIVSILAHVILDKALNLEQISKVFENATFPLKTKGWLKYRLPPENYYIAFYKSGKFSVSGQKNCNEVYSIANRVIKCLNEKGIELKIVKIKIINIVVLNEISLPSNLENILQKLDFYKVSYEPEQFPGLIYKDFGATFLLFSNGKLIITGIKDFKNIPNFISSFYNLIK